MSQLNNLPFIQDAKLLVIDEEIGAKYARCLVIGWLQQYKKKIVNKKISMLLFSTTKSLYKKIFDDLQLGDIEIKDYFTISIEQEANNISEKLDIILTEHNESSIVIVDCISSLVLAVGKSKAARFVDNLGKKVNQLICINQGDFESSNIPCIETLGNVYVKIKETSVSCLKSSIGYAVNYTIRKPNGSLTKQAELVTQDCETFLIISKVEEKKKKSNNTGPAVENIEASFRLDMNSREIEQKKNVDLPYTSNSNSSSSKIIYNPDYFDDLDEEDPDDDLCI